MCMTCIKHNVCREMLEMKERRVRKELKEILE